MKRHPLRPADVERALGGAGPWPPDLVRLVAAAQAPASPGELAGEDAAVAAFRQARNDSARPVRRTLARVVAVKVAAGVAILAAGGYAVAAATGAVPAPGFVPERAPAPVATTPAKHPAGNPTAVPRQPLPAVSPGTPHRSANSYAGLCRAYFNGPAGHDAAPMRDLVTAAGGADRVVAFCAAAGVSTPGPDKKPKPPKASKSPNAPKSAEATRPPKGGQVAQVPGDAPGGSAGNRRDVGDVHPRDPGR
jgi:hypothetical protein